MVDIGSGLERRSDERGGRMRWRVTGLAICITSASVANGYQESLTPDVMALHRAVFELPESQILPDGERAQALGRLYAEGNGVLRDPVMACTLFDLAERALMMKAPHFLRGCGYSRTRSD
jgi:hypothetical protein